MNEINDKLKNEVLDLMYELRQNHFPTERQFRESGCDKVYNRIVRIYGNTSIFCKQNNLYTKNEYIKAVSKGRAKICGQDEVTPDCKRIIDEVSKYVKDYGYDYMPGKAEFDKDGMTSLYRMIYRHFGSIIDIRDALKLPTKVEWRQGNGEK